MDTIWQVILYVVTILCNVALVAEARTRFATAGRRFLSSGRGAIIIVFALCALEMLVVGRFDALSDPAKLVDLLNQAWILAGATVGTHAAGKTLFRDM